MHKLPLLVLLIPGFLLGPGQVAMGQIPQANQADTVLVADSSEFFALAFNEDWKLEREGEIRSYRVPFQLREEATASLTHSFSWPEGARRDTLFLYWEGIGWNAELMLGDYYLGAHADPFEPWVVPLLKDWVEPGVRLSLHLSEGEARILSPMPFLGIFRSVTLLSELPDLGFRELDPVNPEEPVGVVAPYYGNHGYSFDSLEALRFLLPLQKQGISQVGFAFAPDRQLIELCQNPQLHLEPVRVDGEDIQAAVVNWYPTADPNQDSRMAFWLDQRGRRTAFYGKLVDWPMKIGGLPPAADRQFLLLLLLIPLGGLFVIKLMSPGLYWGQLALLAGQTTILEGSSGGVGLNGDSLVVINLVRVMVFGSFVTLGVYGLNWYGQWELVSLGNGQSLLQSTLGRYQHPGLLYLWVMLGLGLWEAVKWASFGIGGRLLGTKGLLPGLLGLEVVRNFPLVSILPLAGTLWILWGSAYPLIFGGLFLSVAVGYWLRRGYVAFAGLDRNTSFSLGMKLLYICTLDIAPVFIWL